MPSFDKGIVAQQLIRANPKLSGNVKIQIDSKGSIFASTIDANELLSKNQYKKFSIQDSESWPQSVYRLFDGGKITTDSLFDLGDQTKTPKVKTDAYAQRETLYSAGASNLIDKNYDESFSFFAPISIKSALSIPDYFVIFRVDGATTEPILEDINNLDSSKTYIVKPLTEKFSLTISLASNSVPFEVTETSTTFTFKGILSATLNYGKVSFKKQFDSSYTDTSLFDELILKKSRIVKTFDLRSGTHIGNFLRSNLTDNRFPEVPTRINFEKNRNSSWFGADPIKGVWTSKVESLDTLWSEERSVTEVDQWITGGFQRLGLLYPHIWNLEFLFDDYAENWTFNRYFGFYVSQDNLNTLLLDGDAYLSNTDFSIQTPKIWKKDQWSYFWLETTQNTTNPNGLNLQFQKQDLISPKENQIWTIQDKDNNLHVVKDHNITHISDEIKIAEEGFDISKFGGFKKSPKIEVPAEILSKNGYASIEFQVNPSLFNFYTFETKTYDSLGNVISLGTEIRQETGLPFGCTMSFNWTNTLLPVDDLINNAILESRERLLNPSNPKLRYPDNVIETRIMGYHLRGNYIVNPVYDSQGFITTNGTVEPKELVTPSNAIDTVFCQWAPLENISGVKPENQIAIAIAQAIKNLPDNPFWIYVKENRVIIVVNTLNSDANSWTISLSKSLLTTLIGSVTSNVPQIKWLSQDILQDDSRALFGGGSSTTQYRFRIKKETEKYIKIGDWVKTLNGHSQIVSICPYVDEPTFNNEDAISSFTGIDEWYTVELQDDIPLIVEGKIQIYDPYEVPYGPLSIFPVVDFDHSVEDTQYNRTLSYELERYALATNAALSDNVLPVPLTQFISGKPSFKNTYHVTNANFRWITCQTDTAENITSIPLWLTTSYTNVIPLPSNDVQGLIPISVIDALTVSNGPSNPYIIPIETLPYRRIKLNGIESFWIQTASSQLNNFYKRDTTDNIYKVSISDLLIPGHFIPNVISDDTINHDSPGKNFQTFTENDSIYCYKFVLENSNNNIFETKISNLEKNIDGVWQLWKTSNTYSYSNFNDNISSYVDFLQTSNGCPPYLKSILNKIYEVNTAPNTANPIRWYLLSYMYEGIRGWYLFLDETTSKYWRLSGDIDVFKTTIILTQPNPTPNDFDSSHITSIQGYLNNSDLISADYNTNDYNASVNDLHGNLNVNLNIINSNYTYPNKSIELFGYQQLSDEFLLSSKNGSKTEYDEFNEKYISSYTYLSKTTPWISKWGAVGTSDVKGRPYRLNLNSAFGAESLAPSHYIPSADPRSYTAEWPWLLSYPEGIPLNEDSAWPYIDISKFSINRTSDLISLLNNTTTDNFKEIFTSSSVGGNVIETEEKWSTISQDEFGKSYTIFKGIKVNFQGRKNINIPVGDIGWSPDGIDDARWNDYKFIVVILPKKPSAIFGDKSDLDFDVVINKTWKNITCILSVSLQDYKLKNSILGKQNTFDFFSLYHTKHQLKVDELVKDKFSIIEDDYIVPANWKNSGNFSRPFEIGYNPFTNKTRLLDIRKILSSNVTLNDNSELLSNLVIVLSDVNSSNRIYSTDVRFTFGNIKENNVFSSIVVKLDTFFKNALKGVDLTLYPYTFHSPPPFSPLYVDNTNVNVQITSGVPDITSSVDLAGFSKLTFNQSLGFTELFSTIPNNLYLTYSPNKNIFSWLIFPEAGIDVNKDLIDRLQFVNIRKMFNDDPIWQNHITSDTYQSDLLMNIIDPYQVNVSTSLQSTIDTNRPSTLTLSSVIGYQLSNQSKTSSFWRYSYAYEPVYKNVLIATDDLKDSSSIAYNVKNFGLIRNSIWKFSETPNIIKETNYPLLGEVAIYPIIDYIWKSQFDKDFFYKWLTNSQIVNTNGISSSKNIKTPFTSLLIESPLILSLEKMSTNSVTWDNLNLINVNGNTITFDIVRLITEEIKKLILLQYSQWIDSSLFPEGTNNFTEGLLEWVKQNLSNLYQIDTVTIWKRNIANSSFWSFGNTNSDKINLGFIATTNFKSTQINNIRTIQIDSPESNDQYTISLQYKKI